VLTHADHILDRLRPDAYVAAVEPRRRRVTVNLPADLLDDAVRITAKGLTSTIVEGLQEIQRRAKRSALRELRGRVRFELDLETTRR
jgi:hypothetical protein